MAAITVPGMFLTGDHASRPAATAVGSGSLYSCSDHGLIYQSDGATWSTWATLGGGAPDIDSGTTAETDDTLVLAPDGVGGVEWVTPAGGGGDLTRIAETVLVSDQADITITGIVNTYRTLILDVVGRAVNAGNDWANLYLRVGDGSIDTGGNYASLRAAETGSTYLRNGNLGESFFYAMIVPSATATSGYFGGGTITIQNYHSTTQTKPITSHGISFGASEMYLHWAGGGWKNTSGEIDQVRIYCPSGDLKSGTRLTIYGRA